MKRPNSILLWLPALILAYLALVSRGQTTKPVVGVFAQPAENLAKWTPVVDVFVGWASSKQTSGRDPAKDLAEQRAWRAAVRQAGRQYVDLPTPDWQRQPPTAADIQAMLADSACIGVLGPDEPDLKLLNPATGKWTTWRVSIDQWNAYWDAVDKGDPQHKLLRWGNFAGPELTAGGGQANLPTYAAFAKRLDVVANDWYPRNKNASRYPLAYAALGVPLLKQAAPGKPIGAFLECSWQNISGDGASPTPADILTEAKAIHEAGATWLVYFPQKPSAGAGHVFDNSTAEQFDAVKQVSAMFRPTPTTLPSTQPTLADVMRRLDVIDAALKEIRDAQERPFAPVKP